MGIDKETFEIKQHNRGSSIGVCKDAPVNFVEVIDTNGKDIVSVSQDKSLITVNPPLSTTCIEIHKPSASINTIKIFDSTGKHIQTIRNHS